MTRRIATTVCLLLAFAAIVAAYGQGREARTPAVPKGTAQLPVLVTTDDSNSRPLRRVSVSLQAGELDVPNIAVTDDEGRAVFRNLPAGNYLLIAMRAGYVRTYYGSKSPGRGPGVAVSVLDGQRAPEVRIRMMRGAAITGTIRSANGKPAANQTVQALMVRSSGGDRRATNLENGMGSAVTDDRGVYRIFGLAPGDYLVLVPSIGAVSDEVRPMTPEEVRWADTVTAGGVTSAPSSGTAPAPSSAPPAAYAPAYFPGTAVAADATVITVAPGEERDGVDFGLQLVPTAQVSGKLIDGDGRPQGGVAVSLKPLRNDGLDLFSAIFNATGRTNPDGTFTIRSVKPGAYVLTARATPKAGPDTPPANQEEALARARQEAAAMLGGGQSGSHWASEEITVQGREISDVVLTLRPGMTITGKIVYEATSKPAPADLSRTGIALVAAPTGTGMNDMVGALVGAGTTMPTIAADGSFSIKGVVPGRYRFNLPLAMMPIPGASSIAATSNGFTLKSVMAGGRDIADSVLDVKAGADVSNVIVTFTDRVAELSGTVFDGAGRPSPEFPIVVFSTDTAYWTLGSRRVQTVRPSSDGKYKIVGLPAGEYYVSAVTVVERTEVYDPQFLNQLVPAAFKITIKEGEKKTQDLRLGGK